MIRVAVKLALITALVATGVHFGYRQLEKKLLTSSCLPELPKSSRPDVVATLPGRTAPIAALQNFQIIVSRDIFQSPVASEKKQEIQSPTTPQPVPTTLNLVLAGTVTGTEQTARAIIINNAGKDRKQQLLQIGDGVPGTGAVIKAIDWNSIKLDVNGKLEVLEMPKPKTAPGSGPSAGLNLPAIPPEPEIGMNSPPEEEGMNGRPSAARPNRRISLPPDSPTLEEPIEITAPTPAEPPMDEPTPQELTPIEETIQPEMPPINAE